MASLPAFHSFNQAAFTEQDGSINASMAQSMLQINAQDPSSIGKAGGGSVGGHSVQADEVTQPTRAAKAIRNRDDGTKDAVGDDSGDFPSAVAGSKPFNPDNPATVELLQQGLTPKQLSEIQPESHSHPAPDLPIVSLNIPGSIIFVASRIAYFLLQSATPPAVLAVLLNLVFYPKSGNASVLAAVGVSALGVLAATLFYLAASVQTMIKGNKAKFNNKALSDLSKLTAASYLFVLGSGGHTTEMISLVKLSQKPYHHTHRRYLITAGDNHSLNQAKVLEDNIARSHPNGSSGTSDIVTVTRARSVHQSYITSTLTSLKCFLEIVDALTNIPMVRIGQPHAKNFQGPHVIITNGPGTGFIVGLVAFILKVFHVLPGDRLKVVFVETWARTHSLGLTGKLFNLTQIADVFVVQSEGLAKAVNKPCIGNVNKKWAELVNAPAEEIRSCSDGS